MKQLPQRPRTERPAGVRSAADDFPFVYAGWTPVWFNASWGGSGAMCQRYAGILTPNNATYWACSDLRDLMFVFRDGPVLYAKSDLTQIPETFRGLFLPYLTPPGHELLWWDAGTQAGQYQRVLQNAATEDNRRYEWYDGSRLHTTAWLEGWPKLMRDRFRDFTERKRGWL